MAGATAGGERGCERSCGRAALFAIRGAPAVPAAAGVLARWAKGCAEGQARTPQKQAQTQRQWQQRGGMALASPSEGVPLVPRLVLTGISAAASETATFPVDMVKTRLQIQGEGGTVVARGALGMAAHIVRTEGLRGLYPGIGAGIMRHLIYTPARIVLYEQIRNGVTPEDGSALPLTQKAAVGFAAGISGQAIASPADLVKVRMQADARLPLAERRYTGMAHAFSSIYKNEGGLAGLWRGVGPNLSRAGLVNMGELAFYDQAKQLVLSSPHFEDNVYAHTAASIISGLFATLFSCPADVAKSRIMNAPTGTYRGIFDCLAQTVRNEGFLALYKGFMPTWSRLGPWQFIFWVSYEQLRSAAGLASF